MAEAGEQSDGNLDLAWELKESVVRAYEAAFAESPDRAAAALQRADEVVELLLTEIGNGQLTPEDMQELGLDEEKLRRVLSWCAFDYSRQHHDGRYEVVSRETFVMPLVATLLTTDNDFMAATSDLETSIIAMRLHRSQTGLGAVQGNPTEEFVQDYIAVSGNPLPPA